MKSRAVLAGRGPAFCSRKELVGRRGHGVLLRNGGARADGQCRCKRLQPVALASG